MGPRPCRSDLCEQAPPDGFHRSRSADSFDDGFVEKIEFPLYKNTLVWVSAFPCLYTEEITFKSAAMREMEAEGGKSTAAGW